jgi:hypothetical protein
VTVTEELKNLDLSSKSFSEFVTFFFDREVVKLDPPNDSFVVDFLQVGHFDESMPSSPEIIVEYMTKLFSEFGQIAPKYSLSQLDQGIWNLLGESLALYGLLWDSSIPLVKRLECIRSMYSVYSDFVARSDVEVMENCFDMWWDLLGHGFWWQLKLYEAGTKTGDVRKLDSESRTLLDVMFDTLRRILELPDPRTQHFALHGLGHLHHPSVQGTVQEYIDRHKSELTGQELRWVEQCRDGTVM